MTLNGFFGVTVRGDNFLFGKSFTTSRALHAIGQAVFGTSGSVAINGFFGVTLCFNSNGFSRSFCFASGTVGYVVVAAVNCASSIGFIFNNYVTVGVTEFFNKYFFTFGTNLIFGTGCCITGGVLAYCVRGSLFVVNGVISIYYFVGVIAIIVVVSRVEFYKFAAVNIDFATGFSGLFFSNVENVPFAVLIPSFCCSKFAAVNVNNTVVTGKNNITARLGVEMTSINSNDCVISSRNNRIGTTLCSTDHCATTDAISNSNNSVCTISPKYFNSTFRLPIGCD